MLIARTGSLYCCELGELEGPFLPFLGQLRTLVLCAHAGQEQTAEARGETGRACGSKGLQQVQHRQAQQRVLQRLVQARWPPGELVLHHSLPLSACILQPTGEGSCGLIGCFLDLLGSLKDSAAYQPRADAEARRMLMHSWHADLLQAVPLRQEQDHTEEEAQDWP